MAINPQSQAADELRKAKKFAEAIPLYQEMLEINPSAYATRWLIYCLRKSGEIEEAFTTAQEALKQYPQDSYLRSEMAWVIYDRDIKPAKDAGDIGRLINTARKALDLDPENELLIKVAGQAVMKTAKSANNTDWKIVAEFAQKINPDTLSEEKRKSADGKYYMSEKEDWFVNVSRAFLECGEFQNAINIASIGLESFPNEIFLIRTIALAQFRSGDPHTAAETMMPLLTHPRTTWYIRSELAEIEMQLGNTEEAYRLLCQALQTRQDYQYKVKNLERFAEVCLLMDKLEEGYTTLAFTRAVRTQAGYPIPETLIQLEKKFQQAFISNGQTPPDLPKGQSELTQLCEKIWKNSAAEGLQRYRGKVTGVNPDRKYAFIRPVEGEISPIVFGTDLPRDCRVDGTLVEYSLEKSFDKKKNRDSFKAVHVEKVNPQKKEVR